MKKRVPIDTGHLKKQVKVRAGKRTRTGIFVNVVVGDGKAQNLNSGEAFYGAFNEYGTDHQRQNPFIRPAFAAAKNTANQVAVETLKKEIDKEIRKLKRG